MLNRLTKLINKKNKLAVGLMSGTSLDGIDAALVNISGTGTDTKVTLLAFETLPYSSQERELILQLCHPQTSNVAEICSWNVMLGEKMAQAALKVIHHAGYAVEEVDFISSHGQTIFHAPEASATFQIGELAVIAERTGIVTVGDFRPSDMAVGGQGAPLVPFVDYLLFASKEKGRMLLNIGGIANVTVLPAGARPEEVIAFDTGPGNVLIDALVTQVTGGKQTFDVNGELAAQGTVSNAWLHELIAEDTYLHVAIPKSTGREYYTVVRAQELLEQGQGRGLAIEDVIATVTAYTAHSIAYHIRQFVEPTYSIEELIVSGGGVHNPVLLEELKRAVQQQVLVLEDLQYSSDAKEALAFVILGNQFLHGLPNNLPSATGAQRSVSMGKLALPSK